MMSSRLLITTIVFVCALALATACGEAAGEREAASTGGKTPEVPAGYDAALAERLGADRKSTRLNSSHRQ